MILVVSASSARASAAIFQDGVLLGAERRDAPRAGGQALAEFLPRLVPDRKVLTMVAADVGPGSFTGVKVGVTFAKTLAWALSIPAAAVSAFDLIAPELCIPARRDEVFVRTANGIEIVPAEGAPEPGQPDAAVCDVAKLEPIKPELLLPDYVLPPSISKPKSALKMGGKLG